MAFHNGYKPNRQPPSKEKVNELRDPKTNISTEDHMQMFHRLVAAGIKGIHNTPGERRKKRS